MTSVSSALNNVLVFKNTQRGWAGYAHLGDRKCVAFHTVCVARDVVSLSYPPSLTCPDTSLPGRFLPHRNRQQ